MAEKTPNQQLAEKLLFKPAYVGDKSAAVKQEAHAFAEGYKKFLDAGKTEREWPLRANRCSRRQATSSSTRRRPTPPATRSISASWARPSCFHHRHPQLRGRLPSGHRSHRQPPSGPAPDPAVRVRPPQLLQDPLLRRHPQVSVGYHAAGHPRRVLPR